MKAVICTQYGSPDVLRPVELPKPTAKEHEILVKIMATAVNSGDVRIRGLATKGITKLIMRLILGFNKPRKPILGTVYSGEIEAVGDKVTTFKVGERVFGMTGFKFGTYAEYIAVSEKSNIAPIPEQATHEEAVSLIFGGQSALYFLDRAKLRELENPNVLIYGATGSVGSAALQIARQHGAEIIAVCSSEGKQMVQELGVGDPILYDREDFTKTSKRFDIVFDAVGKTSKKHCAPLLKKGGRFVTVASLDIASESRLQLLQLKELWEIGALKATIDRIYPLEQIVDAHRYVDGGRKKGNVVICLVDNSSLEA